MYGYIPYAIVKLFCFLWNLWFLSAAPFSNGIKHFSFFLDILKFPDSLSRSGNTFILTYCSKSVNFSAIILPILPSQFLEFLLGLYGSYLIVFYLLFLIFNRSIFLCYFLDDFHWHSIWFGIYPVCVCKWLHFSFSNFYLIMFNIQQYLIHIHYFVT